MPDGTPLRDAESRRKGIRCGFRRAENHLAMVKDADNRGIVVQYGRIVLPFQQFVQEAKSVPADQAKQCDPNHIPCNPEPALLKRNRDAQERSFQFIGLCRKLPAWFPPMGALSYRQSLGFL